MYIPETGRFPHIHILYRVCTSLLLTSYTIIVLPFLKNEASDECRFCLDFDRGVHSSCCPCSIPPDDVQSHDRRGESYHSSQIRLGECHTDQLDCWLGHVT